MRAERRWDAGTALVLGVFAVVSNAFPALTGLSERQNPAATLWQDLDPVVVSTPENTPALPRAYRPVRLDRDALQAILDAAPPEETRPRGPSALFGQDAGGERPVLAIPSPDGGVERFAIEESPILPPDLAARFPEIRTFRGQSLDDPATTMRCDLTPQGFHAIVLSPARAVFVEPAQGFETSSALAASPYIVYDSLRERSEPGAFACGSSEDPLPNARFRTRGDSPSLDAGTGPSYGETLRLFRFAVGTTGEYTLIYGGGTVSGTLAAVTTTVNNMNAILEREVAVRLVLISGETAILSTDAANDGYTHGDRFAMIPENQTKLDTVIGPDNYDVGHVFDGASIPNTWSVWGAGYCCVCNPGTKGRGATIFTTAPPSFSWTALFLTHEIGHQLSASHTFNATTDICRDARAWWTAYEPGAGATIMGYGNNCGDEGFNGWSSYFHAASLEQISSLVASSPEACGSTQPTDNTPPFVSAGPPHTIPIGTPFTLTAEGGDSDGDPVTYGWEEYDLGTPSPPSTDDGSRPIFRSFPPTPDPARTLPRMDDVLGRKATLGESLPVTSRTMNFRVTARDLHAGVAGVATAATQIVTDAGIGPFIVTQPSQGARWIGSAQETVFWDVAGTDGPPVNCASVRISLSVDEGASFPYLLAQSTPNDGSETVTVPQNQTADARVKVEAIENIFFNVSYPDFTLVPGCTDAGVSHPRGFEVCANGLDDDCDGSPDASDADCGPLPVAPEAGEELMVCSAAPLFAWSPGVFQTAFRVMASATPDLAAPRWKSQTLGASPFVPNAAQWKKLAGLAKNASGDTTISWGVNATKGKKHLQGPVSQITIRGAESPTATLPDDGATIPSGAAPVFSWDPGICNETFRVEISSSHEFADGAKIPRSPALLYPTWAPAPAEWAKLVQQFGDPLYWRVSATDTIGRISRTAPRLLQAAALRKK